MSPLWPRTFLPQTSGHHRRQLNTGIVRCRNKIRRAKIPGRISRGSRPTGEGGGEVIPESMEILQRAYLNTRYIWIRFLLYTLRYTVRPENPDTDLSQTFTRISFLNRVR
jgi:hypothetical protein